MSQIDEAKKAIFEGNQKPDPAVEAQNQENRLKHRNPAFQDEAQARAIREAFSKHAVDKWGWGAEQFAAVDTAEKAEENLRRWQGDISRSRIERVDKGNTERLKRECHGTAPAEKRVGALFRELGIGAKR